MVIMKLNGKDYIVLSMIELACAANDASYDTDNDCYVPSTDYINIFAEFTLNEATLTDNVLVVTSEEDNEVINFHIPAIHNLRTVENYVATTLDLWGKKHINEYVATIKSAYQELEDAALNSSIKCKIPAEWKY